MAAGVTKQRVTSLYRRILRLHSGGGLPTELRAIGDEYVKAEFKRHRDAKPAETEGFVAQWQIYHDTLVEQLTGQKPLGRNLSRDEIDQLRDDQVAQLYGLKVEAEKPKSEGG